MCQPTEGFKFCTCEWEYFSWDIKNRYQWILERYIGEKKLTSRGKIAKPTSDLGNGITVGEVMNRLSANCLFDFAYTPAERDSLHVSITDSKKGPKYFSLIFIKGKWEEGSNCIFTSSEEMIKKGFIETKM